MHFLAAIIAKRKGSLPQPSANKNILLKIPQCKFCKDSPPSSFLEHLTYTTFMNSMFVQARHGGSNMAASC